MSRVILVMFCPHQMGPLLDLILVYGADQSIGLSMLDSDYGSISL